MPLMASPPTPPSSITEFLGKPTSWWVDLKAVLEEFDIPGPVSLQSVLKRASIAALNK